LLSPLSNKNCLVLPLSTLVTPSLQQTNLLTQFNTPDRSQTPPPAVITITKINAMTIKQLAAIGMATGRNTIDSYTSPCYAQFSAAQLTNLLGRRTTPTTATTPSTLVSPRMAAVLASSTGSLLSGHSFYGSLDFLDDQLSFDLIFPNPTPLLLSVSHSGNPTVDTVSVSATIALLFDRCKFELLSLCSKPALVRPIMMMPLLFMPPSSP
jgi:hypothetical protein